MITYISKPDKYKEDITHLEEPYKDFLRYNLKWSKKINTAISNLTPSYQFISINRDKKGLFDNLERYTIMFRNIVIYED